MLQLKNQEEHYHLNGWQNDQDLIQSQTYTKRLAQKIETIKKKLNPSFSKASQKLNIRKRIKDYSEAKSNDVSQLKRQFIQQQQEEQIQFHLRSSYQEQYNPSNAAQQSKEQRTQPKQKHKKDKSIQVHFPTGLFPMQSSYLSKYTLFSNIKNDRRIKQLQPEKSQTQKTKKLTHYFSQKRFLMPKKLNLQRLFKAKLQKKKDKQLCQSSIKLPMFLARINKQMDIDRNKDSYTSNLKQKSGSRYFLKSIDNTVY